MEKLILTAVANGEEKGKGREEPQALRARRKVATVATKKKREKRKGREESMVDTTPAQRTRDNGATAGPAPK